MTHDYKRHGTTTRFAALDVRSAKVIEDCMPRHGAKEFLKFLRQIDKVVNDTEKRSRLVESGQPIQPRTSQHLYPDQRRTNLA